MINLNEDINKRKEENANRKIIDIYLKGDLINDLKADQRPSSSDGGEAKPASRFKGGLYKTNRAIFFALAFIIYLVSLNAGCTQPEIDPGRDEIGNPYVALVIEPKDSKVLTGSYKQFAVNAIDLEGKYTKVQPVWSATYGRITKDGEYVAPEEPGYSIITAKHGTISASTQIYIESSNEIKNFFIIPESGEVEVGRSIQLVCRAQNAAGDFIPVLASWSVDMGNITNTGYFSAPGSPTTAHIKAQLGRREAYSNLTVISVRPRSIYITPSVATVAANATQNFTAIVYDAYGNVLSPKNLIWSTTYGKITQEGVYTCPETPVAAQIMARVENVHGFAYVNTSSGATAVSIDISPANAVLRLGESRQFTAAAYDANGVQVAFPAQTSWSAVNGTVNSTGLFTASPSSPGLATLKVQSATLTKEITLLITE